MLYSGTDPASYITEHTLVHEEKPAWGMARTRLVSVQGRVGGKRTPLGPYRRPMPRVVGG